MADRCKHELVMGTCATCLGTDNVEVPDPFEGIRVKELDVEELTRSGGDDNAD